MSKQTCLLSKHSTPQIIAIETRALKPLPIWIFPHYYSYYSLNQTSRPKKKEIKQIYSSSFLYTENNKTSLWTTYIMMDYSQGGSAEHGAVTCFTGLFVKSHFGKLQSLWVLFLRILHLHAAPSQQKPHPDLMRWTSHPSEMQLFHVHFNFSAYNSGKTCIILFDNYKVKIVPSISWSWRRTKHSLSYRYWRGSKRGGSIFTEGKPAKISPFWWCLQAWKNWMIKVRTMDKKGRSEFRNKS